jgi:hypothetical protein
MPVPLPPGRQEELERAALLLSVSSARLYVRAQLRDWDIPPRHIATVELLVAELATAGNTTLGVDEPRPVHVEIHAHLRAIGVCLLLFKRTLTAHAWDSPPRRLSLVRMDGSGTTSLTKSASKQWSYYRPGRNDKAVWCDVDLD